MQDAIWESHAIFIEKSRLFDSYGHFSKLEKLQNEERMGNLNLQNKL